MAEKAGVVDNVVALMKGYAAIEAAKNGAFDIGGAVASASTKTPMVDYQNKGDPASPQIVDKTERTMAGEEHKASVAVNKNYFIIGGGVLLVLAVVFVALDN